MEVSPDSRVVRHRATELCPVATAWHRLVWTSAHEEVMTRFGSDHRLHVTQRQQDVPETSFSMGEIYSYLFQHREHSADPEQQQHVLDGIHSALHEKLTQSNTCSVCGGTRLWNDARQTRQPWTFNALCLLWDALTATIIQHGTRWSVWRAVPSTQKSSEEQRLPPKLQMENIPQDQIRELRKGVFRWGSYMTDPGVKSIEEAWTILNEWWQEDREVRISVLREVEIQQTPRPQNSPGDQLVLGKGEKGRIYTGRVWRSEDQWIFQEDVTGIEVTAQVNPDHNLRQIYQQCEGRLYRAMRAEYVKQTQAAKKAAKQEATKADGPQTAKDLCIRGRTPTGKRLRYTWGSADRGRVEVQVTPRMHRPTPQEGSSDWQRAANRESTPERAIRKMTAKVLNVQAKAAMGRQERIVAKAPAMDDATPCKKGADMEASAYSPALRTLTDPQAQCRAYTIRAYNVICTIRAYTTRACTVFRYYRFLCCLIMYLSISHHIPIIAREPMSIVM